MGRITNFVYGGILIALAIWAMISSQGILPYLLMVMGIIVLFTPFGNSPYGVLATPRRFFQIIRRWVFGIYLILAGLISVGQTFGLNFLQTYGAYASISALSGQVIVILIGAIYFLAAFERTATHQIGTI